MAPPGIPAPMIPNRDPMVFFGPNGPRPPATTTTTITTASPASNASRFPVAPTRGYGGVMMAARSAPIPNGVYRPMPSPAPTASPAAAAAPAPATTAAAAEAPTPFQLTTYHIASLAGLTGNNPDTFHHYFCQAMFAVYKVDQLKSIIRYIRDLYFKQRIPIPRGLNINGRKQNLIEGLVEFVVSTAKPCTLHGSHRVGIGAFVHFNDPNVLKSCTCYPTDEAARNAAAIADAAVLKALTDIPDFLRIDGLYTDIEVLTSAFLRGSGSIAMQFKMDPQKLAQVQSGAYRIFLRRFCPNSTRYEIIDNRILVRVNGQTIIVPPQHLEMKKNRSAPPVDISGWIRNGEQHVFISSHVIRSVMSVQFVRVLSLTEVIETIKKKDEIPEAPPSTSKDFDDDDVRPSNMLVSLRCPLSMIRMNIPAKATTCNHQQCFDLESVISYCKQYNKWTCPICCSSIKHDDIRIDSFFKRVLAGAGPDIDQANVGVDGSIQYIDPEAERKKQEIMQDRLSKRRRLFEERGIVQSDEPIVDATAMDGSSFDCPFVID